MTTSTSTTLLKIAAVVIALGLLFGVLSTTAHAALTSAQVETILNLLKSFDVDQATVDNVRASLTGTAPPVTGVSGASNCGFTRSLTIGARGADVTCLQDYLTGTGHFTFSGGSTGYFGPITQSAVAAWQAANSVAPAVGYFGPISQAKYNSVVGTGTPPPGDGGDDDPVVVVPPGSGLSVSSTVQPAGQLAPDNATRIPFTKFVVTASSDGAVVMDSVNVKRVGQGANASFAALVLLDEDGVQIGNEKTLNSNSEAKLGKSVTIPAGTSKTFTVSGNMAADNSTRDGTFLTLHVTGVNSSATVSGGFPIVGATHTVNASLAIGTVTMARGAFDPGSTQTKAVGTADYTFSSIKVTGGSAENVLLKSVRWNQSGSAGQTDIENLRTEVDGVSYNLVVDGDNYTTVFPGDGLLIQKGFSKDVSIKGDIAGGSSRTIAFDIAKRSDVHIVGETFGYGIKPPQTNSCSGATGTACFGSGEDPWWDGGVVTIDTGAMVVSTWTQVASKNIAENSLNQPIAGFTVDVTGEPVTVGTIKITVNVNSTAANMADVTNLTLIDQNGSVISSGVDGSDTDASQQMSFADSHTFPVGITNITLKGKLGTDFANNDTISASTTPSGWTTVTGEVTGKTVTPSPASAVDGPTMTLKAGAMTVSVATVPLAQTMVAGAQGFEFARYSLDASASGEDVRVTSLPLAYGNGGGATANKTSGCYLHDPDIAFDVNNPSKSAVTSVVNPTAFASTTSFTFNKGGLIVPKNTAKTLSLRCNLGTGTTGIYMWGIDTGQDITSISGVTSGSTIAESLTEAAGQAMTASAGGTLAALLDNNSPGYRITSAGASGVELARIKYTATVEAIDLKQVALQLTDVATNTQYDLADRTVRLYDTSNNLVGSAQFPVAAGYSGDHATSTAVTGFRIPSGGSKVLVVKGDIAAIDGTNGPLTASGDLLKVDYDGNNNGLNGNYGTGVSSGSTRTPASADTASQGVRIMAAYPSLAHIALSTSEKVLVTGADKTLYKFSVAAVDGDVALYKFSFSVGSSTVSATSSTYGLYAYTDSAFSQVDTTFVGDGILNGGNAHNGLGDTTGTPTQVSTVEIFPDKTGESTATTTYIVPDGQTRYFQLRATLSSVETGSNSETISVSLLGDAAFATNVVTSAMAAANNIDSDTANDDFIWSPISTTTQNTINDFDFTNGYQVPGLPATNMTAESLTSVN
jgi:hypothetical protein